MDYAQFFGGLFGPMYVVLGLSFLMYPKGWKKVVSRFADDHLRLLSIMFMQMVLGLVVISLYNVWEWNVWLLVTLTGWGMFLKSVFYFLAPGRTFTDLLKWKEKHMCMYTAGTVVLVIGAVLSYFSYLV